MSSKYRSDSRFVAVAASTLDVIGATLIPEDDIWEINHFLGSAAYSEDTCACLMWDRGGAGEITLYSTHGDADVKVVHQLTGDGTKKLEIVLDNQSSQSQSMGVRWEGKKVGVVPP